MSFREKRKAAKRGLTETAVYLGVTKQAVNAWERGEYEPNIENICKMAEYFGCTIDELLAPDETEASA